MAFNDDEFEFRPLSEGLGFHKKVINLQENTEKVQPQPTVTLQKNTPHFSPALTNKNIIETGRPVAPTATVNRTSPYATGINSHSQLWNRNQQPAKVQVKPQVKAPVRGVRSDLLPSATSWPAAIFDSTMVLGLILVFSAAIFAITRIDLIELIEMLRTEGAAQVSAVILLVSVYGMYTVTCRTFFGKTLGDSVFYYQLGTPQDQSSVVYPAKVFFRSLLIAFTGFILLPLLSTILNKDVAGILSGVSIYAETK